MEETSAVLSSLQRTEGKKKTLAFKRPWFSMATLRMRVWNFGLFIVGAEC